MQRRDNGDAKVRSEENAPHKKNEDLRILIAVPTFESIFPDTYQAIWDLDKCGCTADFRYVRGYDCATARNHIVQTAIDGNYDYVLMVDNDTVLPKDALKNLLDEPVDVCLGYYAHRGASNEYSGRQNVCKYLNEMGFPWFNYPFESEFTAKELHELRDRGEKKIRIHGGGMGCAFIKVDVFRNMEYPWYDWVNYEDRHGMLSEDLFFCEKCKMSQIPVYTDVRVGCGHIMRKVQWPE